MDAPRDVIRVGHARAIAPFCTLRNSQSHRQAAALGYPLALAPRATAAIVLAMPLSGSTSPPALAGRTPQAWADREHDAVAALWRQKLNRVAVNVPTAAQPLADTTRTALAHLL